MGSGEMRPAAVAALRRHRWAAAALATTGLALAIGMPVLLFLLAQERVEEGGGANIGGGPAGVIAAGVWMAWQGLVVYPQENRALRGEGRRVELRPVFATDHQRTGLGGRSEVLLAWLVMDGQGGYSLAIPVEPKLAERAVGGTAAIVRGRFELDGRVVLDFPREVAFPVGRVEVVPLGLPQRALIEQVRPAGGRPSSFSIVWRSCVALGLLILGWSALVDEVDVDDRPCGSLREVLADAPFEACTGEAQIQLAGAIVCLSGFAYLAWRVGQRRRRRQQWTSRVTRA